MPHSRVIWRRWDSQEKLRAGLLLEVAGTQNMHKRLDSTSVNSHIPIEAQGNFTASGFIQGFYT